MNKPRRQMHLLLAWLVLVFIHIYTVYVKLLKHEIKRGNWGRGKII
jgi:hypothetical protein